MNKFPLIGYYGYWVILTYLSVLSATIGIYFAFTGNIRHAIILMMVSGICDTFDGRIANLKKRDNMQSNFGAQIDAMADLIAFGVLPAVILYSIGQRYEPYGGALNVIIPSIYVLAAFIRLAYFTATETEQKRGTGKRKYFDGLPTTSVALLIPVVYSVCNVLRAPVFIVFNVMFIAVAALFVLNIKIPKPRLRTQIILSFIGLLILTIMYFIGESMNG